eukprot:TRINITY_DN3889_c0_g1_i1.p1 TRINITY_DN3889_c0_g1~~TRINITY_DN3889_c0_g1_i1.p1  ORF type:complete len:106 (+),score=22.83 TRINITY_DN3889_c0_g1_i1:282-599(+)
MQKSPKTPKKQCRSVYRNLYRLCLASNLEETFRACEKCASEKRKTMSGDDILYAMKTLGFDSYANTLDVYLKSYRDILKVNEKGTRGEKNKEHREVQIEEEEESE